MKNKRVEFKDLTTPKLTVTKNEVRVKTPTTMSEEEKRKTIDWLMAISEDSFFNDIKFTLRGKIRSNGKLYMCSESKPCIKKIFQRIL